MMKREFNLILERDADGYFVASVPNLPGFHTQAQTLDKLWQFRSSGKTHEKPNPLRDALSYRLHTSHRITQNKRKTLPCPIAHPSPY